MIYLRLLLAVTWSGVFLVQPLTLVPVAGEVPRGAPVANLLVLLPTCSNLLARSRFPPIYPGRFESQPIGYQKRSPSQPPNHPRQPLPFGLKWLAASRL